MKMLVGIDDSDGSFHALQWSLNKLLETQHQLNQDTNSITLVHVQPSIPPIFYPAGPAMFGPHVMIDALKKAQEKNSTCILSRALHTCKEKKVNVETLVLQGDPRDKICQAAKDLDVDLVVVGSRGHGLIKRAFLGSVSSYCAHHLLYPLLIVKPPLESGHGN